MKTPQLSCQVHRRCRPEHLAGEFKVLRIPSRIPSTVGATYAASFSPASRSTFISDAAILVPDALASNTGMPKPS
jgi:hypothetical protein